MPQAAIFPASQSPAWEVGSTPQSEEWHKSTEDGVEAHKQCGEEGTGSAPVKQHQA